MMVTARHQPPMGWPPSNAWKRPVTQQYTSAATLQTLATHSTHANRAPAAPPAAPAVAAPALSPPSASAAAAPAPAAPAPAQQHARTQLSTITPPRMPQTAGSAVCPFELRSTGTLGTATAGKGASGRRGKAPATPEAAPVAAFPAHERAPSDSFSPPTADSSFAGCVSDKSGVSLRIALRAFCNTLASRRSEARRGEKTRAMWVRLDVAREAERSDWGYDGRRGGLNLL